jgi:hypothetical protein
MSRAERGKSPLRGKCPPGGPPNSLRLSLPRQPLRSSASVVPLGTRPAARLLGPRRSQRFGARLGRRKAPRTITADGRGSRPTRPAVPPLPVSTPPSTRLGGHGRQTAALAYRGLRPLCTRRSADMCLLRGPSPDLDGALHLQAAGRSGSVSSWGRSPLSWGLMPRPFLPAREPPGPPAPRCSGRVRRRRVSECPYRGFGGGPPPILRSH